LAFRLVYDYTLGFALTDPSSPAERRLRDTATRQQLHAFLRTLPADRFPALAAHGAHAWDADRDKRFEAGLGTLLRGLQTDPLGPGPPGATGPGLPWTRRSADEEDRHGPGADAQQDRGAEPRGAEYRPQAGRGKDAGPRPRQGL